MIDPLNAANMDQRNYQIDPASGLVSQMSLLFDEQIFERNRELKTRTNVTFRDYTAQFIFMLRGSQWWSRIRWWPLDSWFWSGGDQSISCGRLARSRQPRWSSSATRSTIRPGMGDSLDGSGEPSPESQNVAIVEFPTFANYLRKAVTVLLPDEDTVPPAFNLALDDRYNQDCIRKFLGDSQVSSLYIQRSSIKGEPSSSETTTTFPTCLSSSIAVGATV